MSGHHRRLERMYLSAPCNQHLKSLSLKVSEGAAEVSFEVTPSLHHAAGAMHGSYYFKALDDAAFFAANSLVNEVFVLTAAMNVQLLRPVVSGEVRAKGRVTRPGKNLLFADSVLYDELGEELGRGSGVFARSKSELKSIAGYVG